MPLTGLATECALTAATAPDGPTGVQLLAEEQPVLKSWPAKLMRFLRNGFAGFGQTIKAAFVYHTTGASNYTSADVPGMIRAIYAYHTLTLGWSDIGYNFIVDRFGRLFEGRWGFGPTRDRRPHRRVQHRHRRGGGAGGLRDNAVLGAVVAAFGRILGWKLGLYVAIRTAARPLPRAGRHQPVSARAGRGVQRRLRLPRCLLHLCPGQYLCPRLAQIRSEAATYMGRPGPLRAVRPSRILDSRAGLGTTAGLVLAGSSRGFQVSGRGGVPTTGAGAVVLNLHVLRPTTAGYLTVYPGGQSRTATWNLNFRVGETRANRVIVPVGADGTVTVYNRAGSSHIVVDVNGWYTSSLSTAGGAKLIGSNGGPPGWRRWALRTWAVTCSADTWSRGGRSSGCGPSLGWAAVGW